jgi:tellurite resistance protein TerC
MEQENKVNFDLSLLYVIVQVVFLEGILSIDNAAVLGAMVSALAPEEKVPWPGFLKFLGPPTHRLLGGQRPAALKVGLLGAYLGRGLMLVLANYVIHNPFLKILGAAYLIRLAFENLGQPEAGEDDQVKGNRMEGRSFWSVVAAVELADLAFSLDNVVAVVALSDNLPVVMFGVFVGIIAMRFAASIFTWMILKEPILKSAAYLVVFNIGGELLLDETMGIKIPGAMKFIISAGTLVLFVLYARTKRLQVLQPVFTWIGQGMANINELFDWAMVPVTLLAKTSFRMMRLIFRPVVLVLERRSGSLSQPDAVSLNHNDNIIE